jgi:hypothetical protein
MYSRVSVRVFQLKFVKVLPILGFIAEIPAIEIRKRVKAQAYYRSITCVAS